MASYAEVTREIIKGDLYSEDFSITKPSMTWANVAVSGIVKEGSPEGTTFYTPTITTSVSGDTISFTYTIPAATTATMDASKTYYADIRITADGFGPLTVAFITFNIKPTTNT